MRRAVPVLLVVLLLVALLAGSVRAQSAGTVAGTVRDTTGAPLPGVHVVLRGTERGGATDAAGAFRIPSVSPGRYELVASALGFAPDRRTVTVTPGAEVRVAFVLREAPLRGGEVVVTAARRAQSAQTAAASVSVLDAEDLAVRSVQRLDEALSLVPGVTVRGNQLGIRGSSGFSYNVGSRVLLLVDGAPLLAPDAGGIPFDLLPADRIARVEVLKGPGSALYGSGALGGVVGVFTRDAPEAPTTTARLHGGFYAPFRHAAWRATWDGADRPRPLGGAALTHARRFGDRLSGWGTAGYRSDTGYLENSAERTAYAFGKARWRPAPRLGLDVLAGLTRRHVDRFLYWNGLSDPLRAGRLALFGDGAGGSTDARTTHLTILPSLTHAVSSSFAYVVRGRLYRLVSRPLDEHGRPRPLDVAGTVGYRLGGEVQATWERGGVTLTGGGGGDTHAARSDVFRGEGDTGLRHGQPEGSLFLQAEAAAAERLALTAGARLDGYAPDASEAIVRLSPKLSAAYALRDRLTVRAAWGLGFRAPTVAERFTSDDAFLPLLPNLGLRPEESTGAELGIRGGGARGRAAFTADLVLFRTTYDGLIEPAFVVDSTGAAARAGFRFVNITEARVRGLEAEVTAAHPRGEVRAGYTLLDTHDRAADAPLVFRNRHLLVAAATVRAGRGLSAGVDVRLASRPKRVESDFARFVPDAEVRVPVRVVDVRAAWERGPARAVLVLRNALDYYYVDRPALLAPPRHVVAEVTVRL